MCRCAITFVLNNAVQYQYYSTVISYVAANEIRCNHSHARVRVLPSPSNSNTRSSCYALRWSAYSEHSQPYQGTNHAPSYHYHFSMPHKTSPWCVPSIIHLSQSSGFTLLTHLHVLSKQLVELKNGETFNGHLVNCDNFMNITLREVYQTSAEGDRFWKVKECYIRGSTVCLTSFPLTL